MLLKNATVYNEEFNPVRADIDVQGDKIACVGACVDSGDSLDLSGVTEITVDETMIVGTIKREEEL